MLMKPTAALQPPGAQLYVFSGWDVYEAYFVRKRFALCLVI